MILHTVAPFSCIFPKEVEATADKPAPLPSTNPADYLKSASRTESIRPDAPLPDPKAAQADS